MKLQNLFAVAINLTIMLIGTPQKANGTLSIKVHKISEKEYAENSITHIIRKHSFREVTTRVFHCGLYQVSMIINGNELERYNFELIDL